MGGHHSYDKNKIGIYIRDPLLADLRELSERYQVSLSRILCDALEIAKICKCKVPKGIILFADERGVRQRGVRQNG